MAGNNNNLPEIADRAVAEINNLRERNMIMRRALERVAASDSPEGSIASDALEREREMTR